ncbi:unnamed protein product [Moneuplotes crassus]|uniref:Uncharacterized protein n=1 Tax=Euplotes crassus TaxID=5936 RepID=A0AAD1URL2_EUPCR|nr:unnamed protein product [Moneuplotes crassus]
MSPDGEIMAYQDLTKLYEEVTNTSPVGCEEGFTSKSEFFLRFDSPEILPFLKAISKRLPELDALRICEFPTEEAESMNMFFKKYFPKTVREFWFNYQGDTSPITPFISELGQVSARVTKILWYCQFEINQDELVTLFSQNKSIEQFGLTRCNLDLTSVPNLTKALVGSTIKTLILSDSGDCNYGDWDENPTHFENLIEGLGKCPDFKKNLEEIAMCGNSLSESHCEDVLKKHGFDNVKIWI